MKLLFLYGKPAVGKVTIARALAKRTGIPLFHNHLTVNLVRALFDFGTPAFVALRERIWWDAFRGAIDAGLPALIFTFNPENSVPQAFVDALFDEVSHRGGEVIAVEISASEPSIESRLGCASRVDDGKLVDLDTYRALRGAGVFRTPVIATPRLRIDTDATLPEQAAALIAALL